MIEGHARDYTAIADQYARDVVQGDQVAGYLVRLAAQRYLDDRARIGTDSECPWTWSEWHASDVCDFAEKWPHVEGSWDSPTLVLEPWEVWILACVFGFRRTKDGTRRYREVYIEVAKKQGKSFWTSVIALYCLSCEGEIGPQVKIAASTRKQADVVFKVCKTLVDKSPEFRDHFGARRWAHSITCESSGGTIEPLHSKALSQEGLNPHLAILDELHAHRTRELFDVLRSARGARRNPLSWYITTAGNNIHGVCYEQRSYLLKVLQGIFPGDAFFGVVYTLDRRADGAEVDDDEWDERNWVKANPNLGVSVQLDEMREYAEKAQNSPESLAEFLTKRLNLWVTASAAWVNLAAWNECSDPFPVLRGQDCYGGLDLATTGDTSALSLWFPHVDPPTVLVWFWVPASDIELRTKRDGVPYVLWRDSGYLEATPGDVTDFAYIRRRINALSRIYHLKALGYDRRFSYQLAPRLEEDGLTLVDVPQRLDVIGPWVEHLERLIKDRGFTHGGHPIFRWQATNVVMRRGVDGMKMPSKRHSNDRIDGVSAFLMSLAVAQPEEIQVTPVTHVAVRGTRRSTADLRDAF